jgi:hypothetical protein
MIRVLALAGHFARNFDSGLHISLCAITTNCFTPLREYLTPPYHFRYHILVTLVLLILLCSWKIPYSSASAVGGQPGM